MADNTVTTSLATGVTPGAAAGVSPYSNVGSVSPWAQGYVSDMLSTAQTLTDKPYTPYTGQLVAGPSTLQTQAFQGLAGLSMPSTAYSPTQFGNQFTAPTQTEATQFYNQYAAPAATKDTQFGEFYNAPDVGTATQFGGYYNAPQLSQATQFTNQFAGPAQTQATEFGDLYNAPSIGTATQFTNQFQGPAGGAYAPTEFDTDTWTAQQAQQYMNPYLQSALSPQLTAARREAEAKRVADAARLTQAGAYGGSRQAIMESEGARNLAENLANITGTGYKSAYDTALQQWNVEQGRGLEVQKATEASKQFGAQQAMTAAQLQAQYGLSAQQAQEAARQFQVQQGMTAAEREAQYGLSSLQATESARQFQQQQGMTAAQLQAQYGLSAQQATEAARQYNQTQQMTAAQLQAQYGLSEDQAAEAARQFQVQQGMTAAQLEAQYGLSSAQAQEAMRQFNTQQKMTAAQLQAQYGLSAQQATEAARQFQQQQQMIAAQQQAQYGLAGLQAQESANQFGARYGLEALQAGQNLAQAQATLGGQQREIDQQGLAAAYQQWQNQMQYPYEQLQFQQSMLQGLPLTTSTVSAPQPNTYQQIMGALAGLSRGSSDALALLKSIGLVDKNATLTSAIKQGWDWLTNNAAGAIDRMGTEDLTNALQQQGLTQTQIDNILAGKTTEGGSYDFSSLEQDAALAAQRAAMEQALANVTVDQYGLTPQDWADMGVDTSGWGSGGSSGFDW